MGYTVPMDDTKVEEGGQAQPLPDGTRVVATILPTKKDGAAIEKRAAANTGPNSKLGVMAVRFRVADGQKGAGRNLFASIPLFRKWSATGQGKYPQGTPAFLYFQFFRSLGYDVDQPQGFTIPEDRELFGKAVELVLGVEYDNRDRDLPEDQRRKVNTVKFINKSNGVAASTASSTPAVSADVWATPSSDDGPSSADVWAPSAPDSADVWGADPALSAAASGANAF